METQHAPTVPHAVYLLAYAYYTPDDELHVANAQAFATHSEARAEAIEIIERALLERVGADEDDEEMTPDERLREEGLPTAGDLEAEYPDDGQPFRIEVEHDGAAFHALVTVQRLAL